jgi:hypothetical protein
MSLHKQPHEPRAGLYYTIERRLDTAIQSDWHKFLPGVTASTRFSNATSGSSRPA